MKKQFGFSSVIAVMVVSDNSSALRCSFSPGSRDVCGEVVCEFEPPSWIVMLTARKQYDCRSKHPVRYKFPAITRPRQTPVNLRADVDIHWSERRKMGTDLVNIVRADHNWSSRLCLRTSLICAKRKALSSGMC